MGTKRPFVLIAASVLSLVVGLGTPALAQGRHGGGGAGGPGHGGPGPGGPGHGGPIYGGSVHSHVVVGGYYGYPFWYGFGWYGYPYLYSGWGWPYGPYPYYYPYYGGYDPSASLRLEVTPKDAEVYIDGYLAGTVDDFDGTFQRLHVPPGGHELTLYKDGFKTVHQSLHLSGGSTFKVKYKMEPLAPGEVSEGRPSPPPPPPSDEVQVGPGGPPERGPSQPAPPRRPPPPPSRSGASGYSTLAIRVQPTDAIILIDGERWETSPGQDRLVVDVPEGAHRIEIRKEGFDTYSTEITTARGETVPLNVSLRSR